MLIGKNWRIEADSLNVTLSKRHRTKAKKDKPARDVWTNEGYYSTIKQALIGLVNQGVRDTELKDLKTISDKQDEIYRFIEGVKK